MAEPMTPEAEAAIRARLAAATPGPWRYEPSTGHIEAGGGIVSIADVWQRRRPDVALIAHAPDDIAALLAEVERLRAREARVRLALVGIDKSVAYATAYHRPALREAHNLIAEALRD